MPRKKVDDPRSRGSGASWTGHRQQQPKAGFLTSADAEAAMSEALEARRKGPLTKPSKITVSAYLEDWLAMQLLDDPARSAYEAILRNHIGPRIGDLLLQDLQATDLRKLNAGLLKDGNVRTGGPLEPATVKKIDGVISRALEAAVPDYIPSNPAHRAFGRLHSHAVCEASSVWTDEQLSTFLTGVAGRDDYPLWRMLAMTGARRGEMLGLKWSRVYARKVVIDQQHRKTLVGAQPGHRTKTRTTRSVTLDQETIDVLAAYRQTQAMRLEKLGITQNGDTLVFDTGNGEPYYPDVISKRFRAISARLGLPDIELKNLRHTHATILLGMGVPIKVVQERLGHASPTTTLYYYAFAIPGMDGEAADQMGELLHKNDAPPRRSFWRRGGSSMTIADLEDGTLAPRAVDQVLEAAQSAKTRRKALVHGMNKFVGFCDMSELNLETADLAVVDGPYAEWLRANGVPASGAGSLRVYARKLVRALHALSDDG